MKIRVSELPEFRATQFLDSEEAISQHLTAMIEGNDPAMLEAALGVKLVVQPVVAG